MHAFASIQSHLIEPFTFYLVKPVADRIVSRVTGDEKNYFAKAVTAKLGAHTVLMISSALLFKTALSLSPLLATALVVIGLYAGVYAIYLTDRALAAYLHASPAMYQIRFENKDFEGRRFGSGFSAWHIAIDLKLLPAEMRTLYTNKLMQNPIPSGDGEVEARQQLQRQALQETHLYCDNLVAQLDTTRRSIKALSQEQKDAYKQLYRAGKAQFEESIKHLSRYERVEKRLARKNRCLQKITGG